MVIKTVCYSGTCEIVESGFHLEKYKVCRTCKLEVSAELARRLEEKKASKAESKKIEIEDQDDYFDMYDIHHGTGYFDPMGD
jgi:hypothetical protein